MTNAREKVNHHNFVSHKWRFVLQMMLSSFIFLIYFVCINVSFIVTQYIHADKSDHTLDPGVTGPADMKMDGIKEIDLSKIPGKGEMSLSRGTS